MPPVTDFYGTCCGFIPGTRRVAVGGVRPLPRTGPINLQYSVGGMKLASHGFLTSSGMFRSLARDHLNVLDFLVSPSTLHPS